MGRLGVNPSASGTRDLRLRQSVTKRNTLVKYYFGTFKNKVMFKEIKDL